MADTDVRRISGLERHGEIIEMRMNIPVHERIKI